MTKVVLVNPVVKGFRGDTPNLALGCLVAFYKKYGWESDQVKFVLVDENVTAPDDTLGLITAENPDLVGFSATSMFIDRVEYLAAGVRRTCGKAKIIVGGVHFHMNPHYGLMEHLWDYVCWGEGELAFVQFLDKFVETGGNLSVEDLAGLRGINFQRENRLFVSSAPDLLKDDKIPDPDLSILDAKHYFEPLAYGGRGILGRMASVYTSRGCPYACSFCYNNLLGRKVRYLSAERVVNLLKQYIAAYGTSIFVFGDDLFMGNRQRVVEICKGILRKGMKIRWACNGRAELIRRNDIELFRLMKEAGCYQIQFGFESGSDRILKLLKGPGASVAKNQEALETITSFGIDVMGYFIVGVPGETPADLEETVRFVSMNRRRMLYWDVFVFTPVPGTELWKECARRGLLKNVRFPEIASNIFAEDPGKVRVFSDTVSAEEVIKARNCLKTMLYRKTSLKVKLLWVLFNLRLHPDTVAKRLWGYLGDWLRRAV